MAMNNRIKSSDFTAKLPSLNASETWNKDRSGDECCTDTTLRLVSPDSSNLYGSSLKGTKRKWSGIDKNKVVDHTSLALGLGRSSSSSGSSRRSTGTVCTMSSAKEIDEESSVDLDLNFHLHFGNESEPSPKSPALVISKLLSNGPKLDLQLSLSVRSSESVVLNVPVSAPHTNCSGTSICQGWTVEEGSTSSGWIHSNHVAPYQYAAEAASSFMPSQTFGKADSVPTPDLSSTMTPIPKSPVTCTSGVNQQQHSINTKQCQFQGCGKGARGASGLCIAHGGGRRCQKGGCQKGAEGRTIYCKAHGGGRRCEFLGCTKSAEGRTDYCIAHGGGRRCIHEGCIRAARGKSGLCIRHGGGKRCKIENCKKSAEGHSGLCISHGGGRRCQFLECTKGAQGSTMFCKAHGGGKRCTFLGCNKGAEGSTPFCKGHGGGKRCSFQGGCMKSVHGGTQFCVAHGGGKRCTAPECTKSARGRTDFCVRHGGGRRCKFESCGKSAQGSTDFCKAHGGGKRCSWGQVGSDIGPGGPPCDRFARGKIGLCHAHSALVQDQRVHGEALLGPVSTQYPAPSNYGKMKEIIDDGLIQKKLVHNRIPIQSGPIFLPEGRVHGGSLLAMLASSEGGSHFSFQVQDGTSEQGVSYNMPGSWV